MADASLNWASVCCCLVCSLSQSASSFLLVEMFSQAGGLVVAIDGCEIHYGP